MITGTPGTEIKAGYGASTEATDDSPSVEFITIEDVAIDDSGTVVVHAKAVTPGRSGNVAANTIKLQTKPRKEITAVINKEPSAGGVDEEDNERFKTEDSGLRQVVRRLLWSAQMPTTKGGLRKYLE